VTRWQIGAISPQPTPEEVAAITAALAVVEAELAASASTQSAAQDDNLSLWVEASRRSAQRAALQRGPWRLSGRISRRSRV